MIEVIVIAHRLTYFYDDYELTLYDLPKIHVVICQYVPDCIDYQIEIEIIVRTLIADICFACHANRIFIFNRID